MMKRIIRIIFIPLLMIGALLMLTIDCKKEPTFESRTEGIFPGVGAAMVKIGDSYAQIRSIHGEPEVSDGYHFDNDGDKYRMYWINYTSKGIEVYMKDVAYPSGLKDGDLSEAVVVRSPYNGKTDNGIGIGSSTAQLIQAFGEPEKISYIAYYTYYYSNLGIYFGVQDNSDVIFSIDVELPK
jgi:hypothetical protein